MAESMAAGLFDSCRTQPAHERLRDQIRPEVVSIRFRKDQTQVVIIGAEETGDVAPAVLDETAAR